MLQVKSSQTEHCKTVAPGVAHFSVYEGKSSFPNINYELKCVTAQLKLDEKIKANKYFQIKRMG